MISRVLLVVVVAAIAATVGYVLSTAQDEEFTATTSLLFESYANPELEVLGGGFAVGGSDPDRRTATNQLIVDAHDNAEAVAKADPGLGYTASEIEDHIRVFSVTGSDVIRIQGTSTSRPRVRRL